MEQAMRCARLVGVAVAGLLLCGASAAAEADIVVVVANSSPVKVLTRSQVADIFLGKVNRFPDGGQATPVDQPEGAATRDEFYSTFTGKSPAQIKAHWSKIIFTGRGQPPQVVTSSAEVKKRIAENPETIGYIEASEVDGSVRALPPAPQ
ncbi:substrate-binding domain-containing protein [Pseudomonas sp. Q12-87]|uniref:substrate-binding domain-containing protein n=1 Tax=Pseudomonas sp. Q12-87 TaxID=177989 RepID=UPI00069F129A|nr:substrate-binding domain-containing protein [Pseudomonas sp. Q12-87]